VVQGSIGQKQGICLHPVAKLHLLQGLPIISGNSPLYIKFKIFTCSVLDSDSHLQQGIFDDPFIKQLEFSFNLCRAGDRKHKKYNYKAGFYI